jgi:Transglutaminase-like superfamily
MTAKQHINRLTRDERWFATKSLLLLQFVSIGVRLFGFSRVKRWFEQEAIQKSPTVQPLDQSLDTAVHLGALVRLANHRIQVLKVTCVPESLSVWWLLRRRGIPAQLQLGLRKSADQLDGHAWVTVGDRVVSGDPLLPQDFTPIDLTGRFS